MHRSAVDLLKELWARTEAGDDSAFAELVADSLVNHAAGPQGLAGLRAVLEVVRQDLGDPRPEHHGMFGSGSVATHHVTLHGTHVGSTMPLLQGVEVTGRGVAWTYIHIWRSSDGQLAEHWACRDDVGLLAQLGAWPPAQGSTGEEVRL